MKRIKGFTIIEIIIVVALISIFAATAIPVGATYLARSHLRNKTKEVVSSLRTAQLNSISGKEASSWGVYLDSQEIIMFKGSSYRPPGTAFDYHYQIPSSVTVSPVPQEIVYDRLAGNPNTALTITLTSSAGDGREISINEVGTVNINEL